MLKNVLYTQLQPFSFQIPYFHSLKISPQVLAYDLLLLPSLGPMRRTLCGVPEDQWLPECDL